MNKRITSLLLAVVMICSMLATAVPAFAAPGDSGVSASVTEASPGDTFTVTLTVPGTEKQISDIGVKVHFDSTVFEVTEYTIPSIAGMAKMQPNVAEANSNAFFSATYDSDTSDADITFTGLQLTATFKVKEGAAAGTYAFELDSTCKVGSLTDMGLPDILVKYEDFTSKSVSVTVTAAPKPATGISLNKSTLELTVGESETLVATVEPTDTTDTVTWTSGNTAVATVDTNGKVTAVATGTATITAQAGSQSATCVVTVTNAPCTHTNKSTVSAKDSTCTVKGWDEYKKCDDCGQLFDKNGNEIDAVPTRSLAAHTAQHHARVEPTHAAAGNIEYWTCSVCNKYFSDAACTAEITQEQTVLNKIEHSFGSDWKSNADQHWHECSCGEKNAIANHTFEWKTDTAATEDATGLKHEECTDCHYKRNENTVIPKLEHTHAWQETPAKASTCTEQGNNQYFYCTKCEKYFKADKVTETTVAAETLPLASHTESSWKSDANGHWKECTVCGTITTTKEAHTPGAAATETTPQKCTKCDYIITPALGHTHTGGGGGSYYAPVVPDMPMVYWGCTGDAVKTLQDKLNALGYNSGNVDGIFGAKTYAAVTAFQKANSLGVDGIVGKLTWAKLYDATPVNVTPVTTQPMLRTGSRGDAVRKLQELLNAKGYTCGSVDGIFGSKTKAAVLAFQKANGLGADGIVGPLTWAKLG